MILIGIDDTDNKESRGTGFRSRQLGSLIEEKGLGTVKSISRHQLFFDKRIPFTSQNSSACLLVDGTDLQALIQLSESFLKRVSAIGSDAGLAASKIELINEEVVRWGNRAKEEVLTQAEARTIAESSNVFLEGYTGNKDGIIGALAALGLRKEANDGRCIWIQGFDIREMRGVYRVKDLFNTLNIDSIIDTNGNALKETEKIHVGDWLRPVINQNKITIIAEKSENSYDYEYKVANKEYIKSISD
jgi:hypothetical protein